MDTNDVERGIVNGWLDEGKLQSRRPARAPVPIDSTMTCAICRGRMTEERNTK